MYVVTSQFPFLELSKLFPGFSNLVQNTWNYRIQLGWEISSSENSASAWKMNYFGFKSLTKSIWPIRRYPPYPDFTVCYIQLYVMNWIYIITRFNCIYDKTGATYLFEEGISFHGKDVRIFTGFEQKTYLVGSKMSGPIRWKVRVYQTCQGPAKISALPSPVNVSPHRTCQCSPEMYGPKNMSNPTESDKFYQLYSAFLPISFIQRSSVFFPPLRWTMS